MKLLSARSKCDPMSDDLYVRLGVHPHVGEEEIDWAFKRLSGIYHPDISGGVDRFHRIRQARETLLNPKERAFFDQTGKVYEGSEQRRADINAIGAIRQIFGEMLKQGAISDEGSLVAELRSGVGQLLANRKKTVAQCAAEVARLRKLLDATDKRWKGSPALRNGVMAEMNVLIDKAETLAETERKGIEVLVRARALLADAKFEMPVQVWDGMPARTQVGWYAVGAGTGCVR